MTTPRGGPATRDASTSHNDLPFTVWRLGHLPPWMRSGGDSAVAGRALLTLAGAVIAVTAPLLGLAASDWFALGAISAAMLGLLLLSLGLPWTTWPPMASAAFPVTCLLGLLALGLTTDGVALTYVGVIPLCFGYVGLFLRSRTGLLLLPLACAAYLGMYTQPTGAMLVRLLVWSAFWIAGSEILVVMVAQQRTVARLLDEATRTDALTTLGNRRGLDARLTELRPGDCLVLCDLDHFKRINDSRGHAFGDQVLERFGTTVSESLRGRDYAARYGGEEFVLVLVHTEPAQALAALTSLRKEWLASGTEVTFSAGVASFRGDRPIAEVLAAADAALYAAKAAGRDRFLVGTWDTLGGALDGVLDGVAQSPGQ